MFATSTTIKDKTLFKILATHTSDTVRCWACYCISKNEKLTLKQKLEQIKPFAADAHFGVREITWLSVRPILAKKIDETISILSTWAISTNENVRRFASEASRPRGVWCEHIDILKQKPELALSIIEPLKNDSSLYVQNSVANWLNDASKTQPLFVKNICATWEKESKTKETAYIVKKAMRTIEKQNK